MRKRKEQVSNIERFQAEPVPDTITLYCPLLKTGTRDIVYCLYKCRKGTLIKCAEYTRIYPSLLSFSIADKYLQKYGPPAIPVPVSLRKRRKRRMPDVYTSMA